MTSATEASRDSEDSAEFLCRRAAREAGEAGDLVGGVGVHLGLAVLVLLAGDFDRFVAERRWRPTSRCRGRRSGPSGPRLPASQNRLLTWVRYLTLVPICTPRPGSISEGRPGLNSMRLPGGAGERRGRRRRTQAFGCRQVTIALSPFISTERTGSLVMTRSPRSAASLEASWSLPLLAAAGLGFGPVLFRSRHP